MNRPVLTLCRLYNTNSGAPKHFRKPFAKNQGKREGISAFDTILFPELANLGSAQRTNAPRREQPRGRDRRNNFESSPQDKKYPTSLPKLTFNVGAARLAPKPATTPKAAPKQTESPKENVTKVEETIKPKFENKADSDVRTKSQPAPPRKQREVKMRDIEEVDFSLPFKSTVSVVVPTLSVKGKGSHNERVKGVYSTHLNILDTESAVSDSLKQAQSVLLSNPSIPLDSKKAIMKTLATLCP
jgi:hypothetical protein